MTENSEMTPESSSSEKEREIGRNEPCPCGSGKKYKRCHGVAAAPKLSQPKFNSDKMPQMPPGMENMDPQMMSQAAQMLQRLPRGQLQKLQSLMQRAMAGKDVSKEAEEFQRTLPPDLQQTLMSVAQASMMANAAGAGGAASEPAAAPMTEEEARAIVAKAAAQGKVSKEEAANLLQNQPKALEAPVSAQGGQVQEGSAATDGNLEDADKKGGGIGKFWKNITGNKS